MDGGFASLSHRTKSYAGRMTLFLFLACSAAATGGLSFGYNIGISGGVTSMDHFLDKFFPNMSRYLKVQGDKKEHPYCKHDDQRLTTFTSSLYLAALATSMLASTVSRTYGRKQSMLLGGLAFLAGAAISGAAQDLFMVIVGRTVLGVGVGFTNHSALLYLSEMAPARLRGMLNIGFQLMVTVGIVTASLTNYLAAKISHRWQWRLSLAFAAVPAGIFIAASVFLPDTPSSLVQRGTPDKARTLLCLIRGTPDVDDEYNDIVAASEASKLVRRPWATMLECRYRPQLTMAILLPFFQQFTGINVIMFYAPVLFQTLGYDKNEASLMSAVVTGLINVFATFISIFSVDLAGRRLLLLTGGVQMVLSQIITGTLIMEMFKLEKSDDKMYAGFVVAFICIYVAGFAWSWGPLGWLVPSEIFPLEIRPEGQSLNLSVNMLSTFLIAQAFPGMLCAMKFGLFFFFAGWVAVMTTFVYFFLPETKKVPLDDMVLVWKKHWFWGKFIGEVDQDVRC